MNSTPKYGDATRKVYVTRLKRRVSWHKRLWAWSRRYYWGRPLFWITILICWILIIFWLADVYIGESTITL